MSQQLQKAIIEQGKAVQDRKLVKERLKETPKDKGLLLCLKAVNQVLLETQKVIAKSRHEANPCEDCEFESGGDVDHSCFDCEHFTFAMGETP
jgi:hypothetical protein